MTLFLNEHLGRRSIVWVAAGSLLAFLAGLFAVGPQVLQSRVGWYGASEPALDQSALTKAAFANGPAGAPDRGAHPLSPGSVPAARKSAGAAGGSAAGPRSGRVAVDRGASGGEASPTALADESLFAALERLERQMAAAIARARESVVALEYTAPDAPPATRRVATGVVINQHGEVLSVRIDQPAASPAASVASKGSSAIVARDYSGRCHTVHWVAADAETGLTLLRLAPRAVRPIRASSGGPSLGSQVFVVGNPFGMGHSVSRGHVAGLDRALELGTRQLGGLVQVQVPLYPGDSGAAVVNLHGEWLGVIRGGLAIPGSGSASVPEDGPGVPLAASPPSEVSPSLDPTEISLGRPERDTDFGFAIPVGDALWVADQLRTRGRVDRAYLGVRLEPSSTAGPTAAPESERRLEAGSSRSSLPGGLPTQAAAATSPGGAPASALEGAVLREVLTDTPASQAGLRPGDGIVELDGQPIRSAHDLTDRLDRILSRSTILLGVVRDRGPRRQRISLSLRTASRPETPPIAATGPSPGAAPAPPSASTAVSPPVVDVSPGPAAVVRDERALPVPAPVSPPSPTRAQAEVPAPQPNELRLTLPRAIVDRLEQLERRLEKLESFPRAAAHLRSTDRQISSARNP
jgi:S1-C subfamily serine protease